MTRTAAPAEQQALTTTAVALSGLTTQLVPGTLAIVLAAITTQYTILAGAALLLRLNLPALLAGHHHTLRAITAGTLLTAAALIHTIATLTTQAITSSAHHIAPTHPHTDR